MAKRTKVGKLAQPLNYVPLAALLEAGEGEDGRAVQGAKEHKSSISFSSSSSALGKFPLTSAGYIQIVISFNQKSFKDITGITC